MAPFDVSIEYCCIDVPGTTGVPKFDTYKNFPLGLIVRFQGTEPAVAGGPLVGTSDPVVSIVYRAIVESTLLSTYAQLPTGSIDTAQGPRPVATVACAFGARVPSVWITYWATVLST